MTEKLFKALKFSMIFSGLLFSASGVLAAPSMPHNVYGTVTYNDSTVASDVNVSIRDGGAVKAWDVTDSSGFYDIYFDGVSGSSYDVVVEDWDSGRDIEFSTGGSTELNISDFPGDLPEVSTGSADPGESSAVLNSDIDLDDADSVEARFSYGESSLSQETNWETASSSGTYSKQITGLSSGTSHVYRAEIRFNGTVYTGSQKSFTTDSSSSTDTDSSDDSSSSGGGFTGGGGVYIPPDTESGPVSSLQVSAVVGSDGSVEKEIGSVEEGQKVVVTLNQSSVIKKIVFFSVQENNNISLNFNDFGVSRPDSVPRPPGAVYSYHGISFPGLRSSDVANGTIFFEVSRDWLERADIRPGDITLRRLEDTGWKKLSTTRREGLKFTARTLGFSYFAVTSSSDERGRSDIAVKDLTIKESGKAEGVNAYNYSVNVLLENVGSISGTKNLVLNVDGENISRKNITVSPGAVEKASFNVMLEPGSHSVDVGGLSKQVSVVKEEDAGIPWLLVALAVFGVFAAAAGAVIYLSIVEEDEDMEDIDMERVSSISEIKQHEQYFMGREVKLSGVKVDPVEKTEDGWVYMVTDNTGKILGLSPQKTQGRGTIGGPVQRNEEGELFIAF
ncbi:MAG: PGF-pre-PGF domain-containing protein [Candidatus Nanohalobium sp.]